MIVTQLGHSCLIVEIADARILLDPGVFTPGFEDVRDLDAIVVTHQHPDHCAVERLPALLRGNPGARVLVEPQTAAQLAERGIDVDDLASGREFAVKSVTARTVGQRHAVIHADIPRIDNVGVVLSAPGEPSLFHPGDAIDADPGPVDVLGVPVNAPWCALTETVEFARRIAPGRFVPIHDGLLQPRGRKIYLDQIDRLTGPDIRLVDLAGGDPVEVH